MQSQVSSIQPPDDVCCYSSGIIGVDRIVIVVESLCDENKVHNRLTRSPHTPNFGGKTHIHVSLGTVVTGETITLTLRE